VGAGSAGKCAREKAPSAPKGVARVVAGGRAPSTPPGPRTRHAGVDSLRWWVDGRCATRGAKSRYASDARRARASVEKLEHRLAVDGRTREPRGGRAVEVPVVALGRSDALVPERLLEQADVAAHALEEDARVRVAERVPPEPRCVEVRGVEDALPEQPRAAVAHRPPVRSGQDETARVRSVPRPPARQHQCCAGLLALERLGPATVACELAADADRLFLGVQILPL